MDTHGNNGGNDIAMLHLVTDPGPLDGLVKMVLFGGCLGDVNGAPTYQGSPQTLSKDCPLPSIYLPIFHVIWEKRPPTFPFSSTLPVAAWLIPSCSRVEECGHWEAPILVANFGGTK